MNHPGEELLILYHYGEAPYATAESRRVLEDHLESCDACRSSFEALQRVLAAVDSTPVPERGDDYGREVWRRLGPRLDEGAGFDWRAWFQPRRLALAGSLAVLVLAAFLAGRFWPREQRQMAGPIPAAVRERILLLAVSEHLERSQMVLVELVNTEPGGAPGQVVNIAAEQQRAEGLVAANRIYRQSVALAGDTATAGVLEDLERVLLEIARSPAEISSAEFQQIRRRIESQGIVFKVRVIGSRMREQEKAVAPAAGPGRKSL